MKKIVLLFTVLYFTISAQAQKFTIDDYIKKYKDLAILEMKYSGIPASIKLAQGIIETESGNSDLVKKSNNHFGIKCKSNWTGETVSHDDDAPGECFRKYPSAEVSYRDHSDFLRNSARYAALFKLPASDYKGWAQGLKDAGYATNPRYPQMLINFIEKYNLQRYDLYEDPETHSQAEAEAEVKTVAPTTSIAPTVSADAALKKTVFNGLKACYAKKGTSLLAIATQFNIQLQKLMSYNDLLQDGVLEYDQWIYLEEKLEEGSSAYYLVMEERTLFEIAQLTGVKLRTLELSNNLSGKNIVLPGRKIMLKRA